MKEKIKNILAVALIILLLPYVAVVLVTGKPVVSADTEALNEMEQYVLGVLPSQIPISYELEAMKAQAILIRTSIAKGEAEGKTKEELSLTYRSLEELEELWGSACFAENLRKLKEAVLSTKGQVLQYEGAYADFPYHAVSSGKTRAGELLGETYVYLEPVVCEHDLEAPDYLTVLTIPKEQSIQILQTDDAGYVLEVQEGEEHLSGEEFRDRHELNSSCFTLEEQEGAYKIITKGLGHGFGLSVYGADQLAREGKTCQEILNYFYKNTACITL